MIKDAEKVLDSKIKVLREELDKKIRTTQKNLKEELEPLSK